MVARGFTALKFDPFPGPWRTHIARQDEEHAVETVRAVREAVGPDIDLLIEAHRRLAPCMRSGWRAASNPFSLSGTKSLSQPATSRLWQSVDGRFAYPL